MYRAKASSVRFTTPLRTSRRAKCARLTMPPPEIAASSSTVDGEAARGEPRGHALVTVLPIAAHARERLLEGSAVAVEPEPEQVELPGVARDLQLHPGHEDEPGAPCPGRGAPDAREAVVVGQGEGAQAGLEGEVHQRFRRVRAVGHARVGVQVDHI